MIDQQVTLVEAGDISDLVADHADCAYDLLLGAGVAPGEAHEILLAAVGRLLEAVVENPFGALDLLGCWLHGVAELAGSRPLLTAPGDTGGLDGIAAQVRTALVHLDREDARLLLLRDTYDFPPRSVAAALGIGLPGLRRRLGAARLAFLGEYDPAAVRLLLDLPGCPADVGELAALCDATAPPAVDAELRRHAYRCSRCEETAEAQRRSRRILSRMAVRRLEPVDRRALTAAAGRLAEARLPVLEVMLTLGGRTGGQPADRPHRTRRSLHPAVVGAALASALIAGVATGAVSGLARAGARTSVSTGDVARAPEKPGIATAPAMNPTAGAVVR